MVRREGTRFGVSTSHSVRRSVKSEKTVHSSQNIVVKASTDVKVKRVQKQASSVVENHLQNRALNLKGFGNEAVLPFSLNKNKRWEVIDTLKRDVGSVCCEGNRVTVSEHHIGVGNRDNDCTAVYDSMSAKSKCSPKKTYARSADLVRKETEQSTDQLVAEDADFGTKNRRRRQKKKVKVDKRTGVQEEAFAVNVSYAVNLAAPKHTLYTYPKRGRSYGMDDGGEEIVVLQATKQGTKKRNKKVSRDMLDGLHSLRELDSGDELSYFSEDDDDWEVFDEARCIPRSEVTSSFGMFAVAIAPQTSNSASKRNIHSIQGAGTKERKFQIDFEESEKSERESTLEVEENAVVNLVISAEKLLPEFLKGKFGENYLESHCFPRRFAIDITDSVISKAPVVWKCGYNVSEGLLSTGYQVFAIFSLSAQEGYQDMDVSATVVGARFNQMDAMKVFYGYRDEIRCVSDATERIAEVAANKIENKCVCKVNNNHPTKVKYVKGTFIYLTTVGASLHWDTEVQSQQQIWKQIRASDEEKQNEMSSGRLIPTSCESVDDTCRICYSRVSETFPGTCLQTCNHLCCDECWKRYLITKVLQGDPHITCPEFKCKVPVDRVTLMSLVPYKLASFHLQQKINATVAADERLQWCPSKGCGRVARFTDPTSNGVGITCECGFVWCTKCKQEVHWPATCDQAAMYRAEKNIVLKYVNAENATIVDKVNYKNCPKCNNPIEKIFGCNTVTCPCNCKFCWTCGKIYPAEYWMMFGHSCTETFAYETAEFDTPPMEHVYQLSVNHHFKTLRTHSARRILQAHRLANKVAVALTLDKSSEESDTQASDFPSTTATTISVMKSGESVVELQEEIKDLFKRSSDFLREADSVLEFFEILLASSPPCDLKKWLCQQKSRLAFISQQVDDILNMRMLDVKCCVERVKTLCDNGKKCLFGMAKVASDLSNMTEVPITVPTNKV